MPLLPVQAPPVSRPGLIEPHRTVDVVHGPPVRLAAMTMKLLHGANFNDPAPFALPAQERMRASMQNAGPSGAR